MIYPNSHWFSGSHWMLIRGLRNTFKHLGGSKWLKEPRMAWWQGLQERAQTVDENVGPLVEGACFPPGRGQQSRTDRTDLGRPEHLAGDWNVCLGRYVPRSSWEFRTPVSIGSFPYTSSKCPGFLSVSLTPLALTRPHPLHVCWALRTLGCLGGPEWQVLRASSWRVQKKEATLSPALLLAHASTGQGWGDGKSWDTGLLAWSQRRKWNYWLACGLESRESFSSVEKSQALNRWIARFHQARPLLLKESGPRKLREEGN